MVHTHNLSSDTCHCKLIFTYRFVQNKFLISFYKKLFLSFFDIVPPHFSKTFSISYMLNSINCVFDPYFLIGTGPMQKNTCAYNSRVKITIFFMEKISFSLKLFLTIFMGNPSLRLSEVLAYKLISSLSCPVWVLDINLMKKYL